MQWSECSVCALNCFNCPTNLQAYNHILDGRMLLLKRDGKGSVKVLNEGVDQCVQILMLKQQGGGRDFRGGFTFISPSFYSRA